MTNEAQLINLYGVTKRFGTFEALKDVNLYIRKREFVTLLGPSGCGKTTLLRLIGGFDLPTEGRILFNGQDITGVPPYKRPINTVFQKYALFPHLSVFDNIAFGLKIAKVAKGDIVRRVSAMLDLVNLSGFEKRDIEALSGGQQQRVAIARALVNEPEVLLLDEPLGALDQRLRKDMQIELKSMQQRLGITFIFVTHDQEEALTMSDTIAVMKDGIIQQIGDPKRIYDEPKNAFVADFIGDSNIMPGVMEKDEVVTFAGHTFSCMDSGFGTNVPVDVVVRPEDIDVTEPVKGMLTGMVTSAHFKGVHYEMMIDCGTQTFKVHSTDLSPVGNRVGLFIIPYGIHIMKKEAALS